MKNVTPMQASIVAQTVAGGCDDFIAQEALEELGLDLDDLPDVCELVEQFKCPNCCWWGHEGDILEHTNDYGENICAECHEEDMC